MEVLATIVAFAGNFAPRPWAYCQGQLLPLAQNTALFSLIGTQFGGDGRSTFALPNLAGKAAMGAGRGPGLHSTRLAQQGGTETKQFSYLNLPSHTHPFIGTSLNGSNLLELKTSTGAGNINQPNNATLAKKVTGSTDKPYDNSSNITGAPMKGLNVTTNITDNNIGLGSTGGGQSMDNMQPYLALGYIICIQGLYPSRS